MNFFRRKSHVKSLVCKHDSDLRDSVRISGFLTISFSRCGPLSSTISKKRTVEETRSARYILGKWGSRFRRHGNPRGIPLHYVTHCACPLQTGNIEFSGKRGRSLPCCRCTLLSMLYVIKREEKKSEKKSELFQYYTRATGSGRPTKRPPSSNNTTSRRFFPVFSFYWLSFRAFWIINQRSRVRKMLYEFPLNKRSSQNSQYCRLIFFVRKSKRFSFGVFHEPCLHKQYFMRKQMRKIYAKATFHIRVSWKDNILVFWCYITFFQCYCIMVVILKSYRKTQKRNVSFVK